jgi:hypothetical protein
MFLGWQKLRVNTCYSVNINVSYKIVTEYIRVDILYKQE